MVVIEFHPKYPTIVSRTDHHPYMKDRRPRIDGSIASPTKVSKHVLQVLRIVPYQPLCIWAPSGRETWEQLAARRGPFNTLTCISISTSCERFFAADECRPVRTELPMYSSRTCLSLGIWCGQFGGHAPGNRRGSELWLLPMPSVDEHIRGPYVYILPFSLPFLKKRFAFFLYSVQYCPWCLIARFSWFTQDSKTPSSTSSSTPGKNSVIVFKRSCWLSQLQLRSFPLIYRKKKSLGRGLGCK
jgi:hypothetical protein